MTTYEPGTVAMVTALNRREEYRAYFDGTTWREVGARAFCVDSPATVRPLVVLDPGEDVAKTVKVLHWAANTTVHPDRDDLLRGLADQIEAQTKPPRIDEPGLWGVVMDPGANLWTHWTETSWISLGARGDVVPWEQIESPTLIREGLTS